MRAILTYHSIDDSGSVISIPRRTFERHVAWLACGRVRVVTVEELVQLPESADAVALTFDDGFRNFGDIAAPLLADHGLPATVFVVSGRVGKTNAWEPVPDTEVPILPLLDWESLARLAEAGVTVGGHTHSHRRLATLGNDEIEDEIFSNAQAIEQHVGKRPNVFAYPYGSVSDSATAVARCAYRWACTTELRGLAANDDTARLPRLDMWYFRRAGRLERWGAPGFNVYLQARAAARGFRARWFPRR